MFMTFSEDKADSRLGVKNKGPPKPSQEEILMVDCLVGGDHIPTHRVIPVFRTQSDSTNNSAKSISPALACIYFQNEFISCSKRTQSCHSSYSQG